MSNITKTFYIISQLQKMQDLTLYSIYAIVIHYNNLTYGMTYDIIANMGNAITLPIEDYKKKFRTLYLEGKTIKQCNEILNFNQNTFDSYFYDNTHGFRDYMQNIKKERFLIKAEHVSNEILSLDTTDNAKLLSIQQKEAEFIRETLFKDQYSKRTENTGADGEPLAVNVIQYKKPTIIDAVHITTLNSEDVNEDKQAEPDTARQEPENIVK